MGLDDVLAKLLAEKSIRAAFPLEGDFFDEVVEEEGGITESTLGMPLVNRALEEVLKRSVTVCVFCESSFEPSTDHIMIMEDGCGNMVGHDVPPCMIDDFKDDPNIFWLCDDFAIHPEKAGTHEMMIVILPQRLRIIGADEGAKDPVLLYPATTTDIMLRKHFGMSVNDPKIASAIIAFDLI